MKILRIITFILLFGFNFSCAIRQNQSSFVPVLENKPAVDDGASNDLTQGTKFCKPDFKGNFDSTTITMTSGPNHDGSYWAEGGGCVLKSIQETWATLNNLEAMRFKGSDSLTYKRTVNPTADFTHLYEITYYKSTVIGPIDWTINWYHGYKGTFEAPLKVNINYQRVRGTSNIPIWHGGIVLTKVNKSVTSIAIRNEFKARQTSSANEASARSALSEMVVSARSGAPNWNQLNSGIKANAGVKAEADVDTKTNAGADGDW